MSVFALVMTLVIGIILKVLPATIPTKDGKLLLSKFEKHAKLNEADTTISFNGKELKDKEKVEVINGFNEGNFLEDYYIFPGNEPLFLHPKDAGPPFIVHTKSGKRDVQLFVFIYNDRVDVVKQYKKKVTAYKVNSDRLQKMSLARV